MPRGDVNVLQIGVLVEGLRVDREFSRLMYGWREVVSKGVKDLIRLGLDLSHLWDRHRLYDQWLPGNE